MSLFSPREDQLLSLAQLHSSYDQNHYFTTAGYKLEEEIQEFAVRLSMCSWEVESGSSPELSGEALGRAGIQF